jgi:hypothetical protein
MLDSLATSEATVLVAKLLDLLVLSVDEKLFVFEKLLLFELLEDSPHDEDLEAEAASCV